jgi:hypothetical protein
MIPASGGLTFAVRYLTRDGQSLLTQGLPSPGQLLYNYNNCTTGQEAPA